MAAFLGAVASAPVQLGPSPPVLGQSTPPQLAQSNTSAASTSAASFAAGLFAAALAPAAYTRGKRRLAAIARAARTSRVVAVVGKDGVGKSKVCAALLELSEPDAPPPASPHFADKRRLLERESAESRRNFTCYNHFYSQQAALYHQFSPRLHIIDTPGHSDRLVQVDEALHVAHGAVLVCSLRQNSLAGAGSSHIFSAVRGAGKPMVVFLNGVDTSDDAAEFDAAVDSLEERLGARPVVLFAPIHAGGAKTGQSLLNVLDGTICTAMECSMGLERSDVAPHEALPSEFVSWAEGLKEQLIDALSQRDDELMEEYLENEGEVSQRAIRAALRRAAAAGRVVPLVAGSAKNGLGVDALQEVIQTFIQVDDGTQIANELGIRPVGVRRSVADTSGPEKAPFMGWVVGRKQDHHQCLLHIRVLSGKLTAGKRYKFVGGASAEALPTDVFSPEEIYVHGPGGEMLSTLEAGPGDLIYLPVSGKYVPKPSGEFLITDFSLVCHTLEGHAVPQPERPGCSSAVLALDSLDKRDQEKLKSALAAIAADDPGLRVEERTVSTGKETLLTCMGSMHLELITERLAEEFGVLRLPLGQHHVDYRATLKDVARGTGQHQLQGKTRIRKGVAHTHAGKVDAWAKVELEPVGRGEGVSVEAIAAHQKEALLQGVRQGLEHAGPSGIPLVDVRVKVLEAEASSKEAAVQAAASAVQKAVQDSHKVTLLEPYVSMELDVPKAAAEGVMDDLQTKRRGLVCSHSEDSSSDVIGVEVPLREIHGYSGDLEKLTGGEGLYSMSFDGYREVLPQVEKQILQEDLKCEPPSQ